MGRLVDIEDVKALISGLDSLPWEEELDDLVKTIPTAYDVEKVVGELEEYATSQICYRYTNCPYIHDENIKCENCGAMGAIDIVKRGGIE
jgi:hypothetical protein